MPRLRRDTRRPAEELAAVLPVEPASGERVYLCAFAQADGTQSWLALDDRGSPLTNRTLIRDAASIAALVEIAEESAAVPVGDEPRLASPAYLDSLGAAAANGDVAGLAQCSELTWQLRGQADKRQVDGAKVALQHNIGLGGAAVVTVYKPAS